MIPWANPNASSLNATNGAIVEAFPEDAEEPGVAYFLADQAATSLDWNPNQSHSYSAKYYFQDDPTKAPYAYSSVPGFTQRLKAGSQVVALSHTQIVKSNLSVTETFGFARETAFSTLDQPFTPAQFALCESLTKASAADCTINTFGSNIFPGITIGWPSAFAPAGILPSYQPLLNIGAGADPGSIHGSISKPLQSFRQRHLDGGQTHHHFRRQLCIYAAQYAGQRNQLGTIDGRTSTNFCKVTSSTTTFMRDAVYEREPQSLLARQ